MSRNHDKALAEARRAGEEASRWRGKLASAQESLAQLEHTAGSVLLDDPAAEARLPHQIDVATSQVRAFERAVREADARLDHAQRAVLVAEADDEDAAAAKAERDLQAISARVDALLAQLLDANNCRYVPAEPREAWQWGPEERPYPHTDRLAAEAQTHRVRALVLRHTALHGALPTFGRDVDGMPPSMALAQIAGDLLPESAQRLAEGAAAA